jgi:hypothetical protein
MAGWYCSTCTAVAHGGLHVMDSDRICTVRIRMSLFTTFYFEFGYKYEYYRIRIQNGYFEFGFTFEYLLDL